jgi:hypothetical protein
MFIHRVQTFISVTDKNGPSEHSVELSFCNDPSCACGVVYLRLTSLSGQGDACFLEADPARREIKLRGHDKNVDFAELFHAGLSEDDWTWLWDSYIDYKELITPSAPVSDIHYKFDETEVEGGGMIFHQEVLPFARPFKLTLGGARYMFVDMYCLSSKCGCHDTCLGVTELRDANAPPVQIVDFKRILTVDYLSRHWAEHTPDKSVPFGAAEIKKAAGEQIPDIYEQLKARHERLRLIYDQNNAPDREPDCDSVITRKLLRAKDEHTRAVAELFGSLPAAAGRALPTPMFVRPGDPCPCGSGKKYKKCCRSKGLPTL